MNRFSVISGRLTEAQRYINVPVRWLEEHPARERRELWLSTAQGDVQLVVHAKHLPARSGHLIAAVMAGRIVVGMANLTTGRSVNFIRSDPPLAWRRKDAVVVAMLAIFALLSALGGLSLWSVLAVGAMVLGLPLVVATRLTMRCSIRREVDRELARVVRDRGQAQHLWRVK